MDVIVDGLVFGEGPRWHDGRLWLSDMHAGVVLTIDGNGTTDVVCEVPAKPSGLGWLPDGRLLVVSMIDRRILRREADGARHARRARRPGRLRLQRHVVDQRGNAYVGHFGFDFHDGSAPAPAEVVLVRPDGSAVVAATGLAFPNGSVVTPDGSTLIVAESMAGRLTAFGIAADGTLHDRRVWAELGGGAADGITLDAEGAVWYADPRRDCCVRVAEGGEVARPRRGRPGVLRLHARRPGPPDAVRGGGGVRVDRAGRP